MKLQISSFCFLLFSTRSLHKWTKTLLTDIETIEAKVIDWRHYFHQNPELSNREFKTAEKIATHLKSLGLKFKRRLALPELWVF